MAAGDFVFVSGCTSVVRAELVHKGDAYAQAAQAISNVGAALARFGIGLADVVKVSLFVTDITRWEDVGRAHAEAFGAFRPACTMVEVAGLVDPEMLVEVEAVAYRKDIGELRPAAPCGRRVRCGADLGITPNHAQRYG